MLSTCIRGTIACVPTCCRLLITEINANHEGRTPEALARNQLLIRELNGNIAKARHVPHTYCVSWLLS